MWVGEREPSYEACLQFADPVFVRAQGTNGAKLRFQIMGAVLKIAKLTEADVRVDEVIVAPDGKTATVRISLQAQGQWKPLDPSRWVLSDGQWYMAF